MMEIDVGGGDQAVMENVETVEVVASGDEVSIPVTSTAGVGLMEQHMMVTHPEGILVPTSEVSPHVWLAVRDLVQVGRYGVELAWYMLVYMYGQGTMFIVGVMNLTSPAHLSALQFCRPSSTPLILNNL